MNDLGQIARESRRIEVKHGVSDSGVSQIMESFRDHSKELHVNGRYRFGVWE